MNNIQTEVKLIDKNGNKLNVYCAPVPYCLHISIFTLIIPVVIYIIVLITNNIVNLLIGDPKKITSKSLQLFYLYIYLLLIIIAISIIREEFDKYIKNSYFSSTIFQLAGPIVTYFASDIGFIMNNLK